jgi:hypothetical protein
VAEYVAGGHGLLAAGGEFGPVGGDGFVQVELAAVGEDQTAQRGHGLGGRPHVDDGVALPVAFDARNSGCVVVGAVEGGRAAPQIGDELAADGDRHRRPDIAL